MIDQSSLQSFHRLNKQKSLKTSDFTALHRFAGYVSRQDAAEGILGIGLKIGQGAGARYIKYLYSWFNSHR